MARLLRSGLSEIKKNRRSIGKPDQHESATAEIAGNRMGDCKRKANRHCGIGCIPAMLKNAEAGICGQRLLGDHHAMSGSNRFRCVLRRRLPGSQRAGEEKQAHHYRHRPTVIHLTPV